MEHYNVGIDIGSTTVKYAFLDQAGELKACGYRRHLSKTQPTLALLLKEAKDKLGDCLLSVSFTGSGALSVAKALNLPFVQEAVAVVSAISRFSPQADVAVELGGEDAKLIFLRPTREARMNGVCAGGTGAFIDQMASLLHTDASGLDRAAREYRQIYPIAARCGVFAKSDLQSLINDGADVSDIAASIFQAVVSQTVSGLACGREIKGKTVFLGGPLSFLPELRNAFVRGLGLAENEIILPKNSHLFAALGAAYNENISERVYLDDLIRLLSDVGLCLPEGRRLAPLFCSVGEYEDFSRRHGRATVATEDLHSYRGDCFLGVDAGSTTSKLALIGSDGQLLFSYYSPNNGRPIETVSEGLSVLKEQLPNCARIARTCATGYGEALMISAFCLDEGEVETVAHSEAAAFFDPDVDCVLDIGGQDMKCIRLKNGVIDSVLLNEACSSGCGSFLENFASSLGCDTEEFASLALFASAPVDLGARCTVFMNSNVKQAQQEGAGVADIAAGLSVSIVKNALFKVIKLTDYSELGHHIVVQGGTFLNDAILRAFEQLSDLEVVRPNIAGLMGAFGAALTAREHYQGQVSKTKLEELLPLQYKTTTERCGRCVNNCLLTIASFPGGRKYISGNRCERGVGADTSRGEDRDLFVFKRRRLFDYPAIPKESAVHGTIGIPRALNIYENYPFWAVFFRELGFRVELSPFSDRSIYELGMSSVSSESACYPAKLVNGHIKWLISRGVDAIFYPCVFYERKESVTATDHYNCPLVIGIPEGLKNTIGDIDDGKVRFLHPFLSFASRNVIENELADFCLKEWNIRRETTRKAVSLAWTEQLRAKDEIRAEGKRLLDEMKELGGRGIVLAGRPYHLDPEINHSIPEMITSYGMYVFTEDCLPQIADNEVSICGGDQWVYHSRLYNAARFVRERNDLEFVQLNSFGCGLDAVTKDRLRLMLEERGKLYTVLRIDEINNLGAARIRLRSLIASMDQRMFRSVFNA